MVLASSPRFRSTASVESIKVVVRCRPLSDNEVAVGYKNVVRVDTERGVVELWNTKAEDEPPKAFMFDAVYDESSKQIDLYDETFRELVDSVLDGFNGTIFAYGQTGSGKTYTMEGDPTKEDLRGVASNSFAHIFQHIAQSHNQQYLVRASYLEIYQEEVHDLLSKTPQAKMELREKPDIGVYVKDLTSFVTKSVEEIEHIMKVGQKNRSVGRTNMNEHSSRSHAIFVVTVECSETKSDGESHIRVGRLNLVDLAGSERQSKAGTFGKRFKEATKINLSLSALGNVISALVDGKSTHIPYRDSKLTRLLQDSLGGNSKTIMVANIGPASYNYEETLGTLRYASRAKNIKNKPRINEDPKDALLREFQEEIARLREMLEKRASSSLDSLTAEKYLSEQQEKRQILAELEERVKQLEEEKKAQLAVAAQIRALQSKLLSGDGNLLNQTNEQQKLLDQRRRELADQKKKEREILRQLEAQEDSTAEIHQTFTNLRQEVEAKTRKLKKFYLKLQQVPEIADAASSHSQERQDLEASVTEINKELKLKLLILENFIPPDVSNSLRERAYWDDDEDMWKLGKISGPSLKNNAIEDGLLTSATDSGVVANGTSASVFSTSLDKDCLARQRPVSNVHEKNLCLFFPKLCNFQPLIMRYSCENLVVFLSLEKLRKRTKSYKEALFEIEAAVNYSYYSYFLFKSMINFIMLSTNFIF
uniref:Kinesin-like protein n=1 Tax=Syphacia muris TaxID=451379 RepID=A0A0N5AQQ1_9BILA